MFVKICIANVYLNIIVFLLSIVSVVCSVNLSHVFSSSSTVFTSFSPQVTSHPETVSQSMSLQQPPQSQYSMPDRDKQLLFSEFENLSASFRSLYKSVFEQSFSQQGEWPHEGTEWKSNRA